MTNGTSPDPLDRAYAPGWIEEEGAKLRGQLVERGERDAGFGPYPIYTIELKPGYTAKTKDGSVSGGDEVAVHAQRDVLRRKLANARLSIGDEVGLKYQGPPLGTAKSHRYRVLKFAADGGYVEAPYEVEDVPLSDTDADTAAALKAERDERDTAMSVAEIGRRLHAPLTGEGTAA